MDVLIIAVAHSIDQPGGSQKIALDEAAALRDRGATVWMLAHADASLPEYEERDGIRYLRYVPASTPAWSPRRGRAHQDAVKAVLRRHLPKVDVVHGHIHLAFLGALDFYGGKAFACFTLHSPIGMEMEIAWRDAGLARRLTAPLAIRMLQRMEAECLRRSQATTALSQYTVDCVRRTHGDALARAMVVAPGWVDSTRYVPARDVAAARSTLGWPADVPVLFTLRRLVPRMGLDRLLDAAHRLRREGFDFRLMIGGSGPLRPVLESQAQDLGLSDTVSFLGRVVDELMPLSYAACDAFVLPTSELECFGIIVLEALSAGRPVLATPIGAIPEILNRFEPQWLAADAETESIHALLRAYLEGKLPVHTQRELHDDAERWYGYDRRVNAFLAATIEKAPH